MERPRAKRLQLLCLPYAGASATVFSRWRALASASFEVVPVELPGRGRRSGEALATDLVELANGLAATLAGSIDAPYALFGHSMGAILAFELARLLGARGKPPSVLFTSGSASPALRRSERFTSLRTDAELVAQLQKLGGTRREVFESPEILALTLPILRADFALCAGYHYQPSAPLDCALHVFGGLRDEIGLGELEGWRAHSRREFTLDMLDGGHFFIHSQEGRLLELISHHARALPARAANDGRAEVFS